MGGKWYLEMVHKSTGYKKDLELEQLSIGIKIQKWAIEGLYRSTINDIRFGPALNERHERSRNRYQSMGDMKDPYLGQQSTVGKKDVEMSHGSQEARRIQK